MCCPLSQLNLKEKKPHVFVALQRVNYRLVSGFENKEHAILLCFNFVVLKLMIIALLACQACVYGSLRYSGSVILLSVRRNRHQRLCG